jgi:5-methylcytosine-specific restriction protein A
MFEVDRVYHRRTLQEEIGGQRYGGIATPAQRPIVVLISGEDGRAFGYQDEFLDDGTIVYYGEGQEGDMAFAGGNKAILEHADAGEELHFFEKVRDGYIRYRGQYDCAGFEYREGVPDRNGSPRRAIVFLLVPHDRVESDGFVDESGQSIEPLPASLDALRDLATQRPAEGVEPAQGSRRLWRRSAAVRRYVLARSLGACEGCGEPAPFLRIDGQPYLEPHHTTRISDGGPDHPRHVIALCPTCHRRAHHAADASDFNRRLIDHLGAVEA